MSKIKLSKSRRKIDFFTARCRWEQEILRRICKSTPSIDADKGGSEVIYRTNKPKKEKKITGCKYSVFSPWSLLIKHSRSYFFFFKFLKKCDETRCRPNNFELSRLVSWIYLKDNYQKMMQRENSSEFVAPTLLFIIYWAIDLQEWQTSYVYVVCKKELICSPSIQG